MKSLNEQEFLDWADAYLCGELSAEEKGQFEAYCEANPEQKELLAWHQSFVDNMKRADARANFKHSLEQVAVQYHEEHAPKPETKVVSLWYKLKLNAAVAAAIAIVSVFSTLWLTGYYKNLKKTTSDYSAL